jgi:hypothetical protein
VSDEENEDIADSEESYPMMEVFSADVSTDMNADIKELLRDLTCNYTLTYRHVKNSEALRQLPLKDIPAQRIQNHIRWGREQVVRK